MRYRKSAAGIGAMALAASALALAQAGGEFELTRHTIDGGGGTSSGGEFTLTGTIGQPDASPQAMRGGEFSLSGGFWAIVDENGEIIFLDGFETLP